jgi:hypothetical protein
MYKYLQKLISKKTFFKLVFCWHLGKVNDEIAGSGSASGSESGSGSISQRHGSADPDPDPDQPQNIMDPQNCKKAYGI